MYSFPALIRHNDVATVSAVAFVCPTVNMPCLAADLGLAADRSAGTVGGLTDVAYSVRLSLGAYVLMKHDVTFIFFLHLLLCFPSLHSQRLSR